MTPARTAAPPATSGASLPSISLKDLEQRFAGRGLALVGGLLLVLAAFFFLSLAWTRGWISEEMRALIVLAVGMVLFVAGGWFLARANAVMGNVLTGVGLGVFLIALFVSTTYYELVSPEVGLAGALVASIAAAAIAIRFDARAVAVYGLIAALVAPPVVGASPTLLTLLYVAIILVGTTVIALFRSWRWLPSIAFVLAAPQLASWLVGDPDATQALVALAGFWLVNIVAAAGEEVRIRRDDLRPSSAMLVLANGVFLLWGGWAVLVGDLEPWLGTFVAIASLAHLLVGGWFLARQGMEHLFGNLVAGTGVALLAIAAFVQLGAPAVPVAWAAEAVALAWLAVRRRHRWSAGASLVLAGLAVSHLLVLEYPVSQFGIPADTAFDPAFLHPEGGSLAAVLLAVAVSVAVVPVRWIRSLLCAAGVLIAGYAMLFELTGPALAAALVGIAILGLLLDRLADRLSVDAELERLVPWVRFAWSSSIAGAAVGATAVILLFSTELPPGSLGELAAQPFLNAQVASLVVVLAGLAVAGLLVSVRWIRSALAGVGILLVAWALAFQVTGPALVALLVVLLPAGVILDRGLQRLSEDPRFARASAFVGSPTADAVFAMLAGALAWCAAAWYAVVQYLNPLDWGRVTPPEIPFSDERALVAAFLALGTIAAATWLVPMVLRRIAILATFVVGAWVVPFEVYADLVVVLWAALAVASAAVTRWDARGLQPYTGLAGLLTVGAAVVAFAIVAPPTLLWVTDPAVTAPAVLLPAWPLSFAALAVTLFLAPRHAPLTRWRTWLDLAAGVVVVYGVSIGIVAAFQGMAGGATAVEELAKQAQVALSVTWTVIGATLLAAGLVRDHPMLRHAGFGLLGLAVVKVFLIDLASMDVAYRALAFGGVGLVLLACAWLYTHFRGPRSGATGIKGGPQPAA